MVCNSFVFGSILHCIAKYSVKKKRAALHASFRIRAILPILYEMNEKNEEIVLML